jgi:hypothetical protein
MTALPLAGYMLYLALREEIFEHRQQLIFFQL